MHTTLYGIPNCDTVKRARQWLKAAGVDHGFHDLRKDGLDPARLEDWCARVGWETLLNRRGTTWKQLPAAARDGLVAGGAQALMLAHPTLIKRPVLEAGTILEVGFDADRYSTLFKG